MLLQHFHALGASLDGYPAGSDYAFARPASLRDQPVWLPIQQQLGSTGHVLRCIIPVTKGNDAGQMV